MNGNGTKVLATTGPAVTRDWYVTLNHVFCSGVEPRTTGHVTPVEAIWVWQLWMSDRKIKLKIKRTGKRIAVCV